MVFLLVVFPNVLEKYRPSVFFYLSWTDLASIGPHCRDLKAIKIQ